jgi:hypothetical protein
LGKQKNKTFSSCYLEAAKAFIRLEEKEEGFSGEYRRN